MWGRTLFSSWEVRWVWGCRDNQFEPAELPWCHLLFWMISLFRVRCRWSSRSGHTGTILPAVREVSLAVDREDLPFSPSPPIFAVQGPVRLRFVRCEILIDYTSVSELWSDLNASRRDQSESGSSIDSERGSKSSSFVAVAFGRTCTDGNLQDARRWRMCALDCLLNRCIGNRTVLLYIFPWGSETHCTMKLGIDASTWVY
jgi:hypothetical protein